jgi:hypothetical protein
MPSRFGLALHPVASNLADVCDRRIGVYRVRRANLGKAVHAERLDDDLGQIDAAQKSVPAF